MGVNQGSNYTLTPRAGLQKNGAAHENYLIELETHPGYDFQIL